MIEQITDHEGQARARLADQFDDKANILAVLDAFTAQVQAIEDAFWDQIAGRTVQYATGATLDAVGEMVGQPRSVDGPDATDDDAYRALIYGRIILNTGYGTPETVYSLLRQIGATGAVLQEPGLASLRLSVIGSLLVNSANLRAILESATPPVALDLSLYDGSGSPFGFDGDPDAAGFDEGELSEAL
jgi:hypothetical protein